MLEFTVNIDTGYTHPRRPKSYALAATPPPHAKTKLLSLRPWRSEATLLSWRHFDANGSVERCLGALRTGCSFSRTFRCRMAPTCAARAALRGPRQALVTSLHSPPDSNCSAEEFSDARG